MKLSSVCNTIHTTYLRIIWRSPDTFSGTSDTAHCFLSNTRPIRWIPDTHREANYRYLITIRNRYVDVTAIMRNVRRIITNIRLPYVRNNIRDNLFITFARVIHFWTLITVKIWRSSSNAVQRSFWYVPTDRDIYRHCDSRAIECVTLRECSSVQFMQSYEYRLVVTVYL